MSVKGKKVGFLGAGNMGEAMIRGLLKAGTVPAEDIFATDVRLDRLQQLGKLYGIHTLSNNSLLVKRVDVVILAVKPQIIHSVLKEVAPAVTPRKLVISVAAGVPTVALRADLPRGVRLIRVMPNTPALVLEGVTAVAKADGLQKGDLETAEEIFGAVGKVVVLEEEALDAVTGLSGSGPAYVALMIEALADGGVKVGLDRLTAMTLAAQTVLGSAKLLIETGAHPGQLKDMVTSPGGTAIAGIAALEEGGVRRTLISAVERATLRSRELGRGARDSKQDTRRGKKRD
ncbi:MAG: pyrroline-5-carboxylate reductase [Candidatus Rokubacteria bacterium]|nr:pyrroline-5-carboxylate reductase [Candidatus Rokubacteria bacterium]